MRVHNSLPLLFECLERWESKPTRVEFEFEYVLNLSPLIQDFFEDFYEVIEALDWNDYRTLALSLDSENLEFRLRESIRKVEALFEMKLAGDVFLLGTFGTVDGYARFDRGTHCVFMGVDQWFPTPKSLDVLMVHELTHVARESRPEVWEGWGLNPLMTQSEFTNSQPVIEHLMGEGFSCAVSELLVPGEDSWIYVYQTESSLARIHHHADLYNEAIHQEIMDSDGDYGRLYGLEPVFSHYHWACEWVKGLISNRAGGNPKNLLSLCSKALIESALQFRL